MNDFVEREEVNFYLAQVQRADTDSSTNAENIDFAAQRAEAQQQLQFARELRAAVIGMHNWRVRLPDLRDDQNLRVVTTRRFVTEHRSFLRIFEVFEEAALAQILLFTNLAWLNYMDGFPSSLQQFSKEL